MKKKYDKNFWILMSILFPLLWLLYPYVYFSGNGCFSGRGMMACGNHAIIIMIVVFFFSITFPFLYFTKVIPEIKKQEDEELQKILQDEFEKTESQKNITTK